MLAILYFLCSIANIPILIEPFIVEEYKPINCSSGKNIECASGLIGEVYAKDTCDIFGPKSPLD